jgi:hypothetical protein
MGELGIEPGQLGDEAPLGDFLEDLQEPLFGSRAVGLVGEVRQGSPVDRGLNLELRCNPLAGRVVPAELDALGFETGSERSTDVRGQEPICGAVPEAKGERLEVGLSLADTVHVSLVLVVRLCSLRESDGLGADGLLGITKFWSISLTSGM